MIEKIVLTAMFFVTFLLIPGMMKDSDPPMWVMVTIIVIGSGGFLVAFFGGIALVWMR